MVQTVKSPKGLSGKICPREVSRVIRLSRGAQPRGQICQMISENFSLFVRLRAADYDQAYKLDNLL